jgi:hypothetical protein
MLRYAKRRVRSRLTHKDRGQRPTAVNNESMLLFPKGELPTARLLSREPRERLAADTRRWAARQWRWLAPRTLPLLVAAFGLVGVVASGRYLSRLATQFPTPERTAALELDPGPAHLVHLEVCPGQVIDVDVTNAPQITLTPIDR